MADITSLADMPGFAGRHPASQPRGRRPATAAVVAIIHLLFFLLLVIAIRAPDPVATIGTTLETVLYLGGRSDGNAPEVTDAKPDEVQGAPPVIVTAPITVPPPLDAPTGALPEGATPSDILGAIGRDLACGANSYEYLNQAQRNRCQHIPWHAARTPEGIIVLADPRWRYRFAPPPEPERVSGADAQRRAAETGIPCPTNISIPCRDLLK